MNTLLGDRTLYFLRNLRMDTVSLSVMLHYNGKPNQGETLAYQLVKLMTYKKMKGCEYITWDHIHNNEFFVTLE